MALRHHVFVLLSIFLSISFSLASPTPNPGDHLSPRSATTLAKRSTAAHVGIAIAAVVILALITAASVYLGCCCCLPGVNAPLLQLGWGRSRGRSRGMDDDDRVLGLSGMELEYQGNFEGQLQHSQPQPHLQPHARAESRTSIATEETLVPENQQAEKEDEKKSQQTQ